MNRSALSQSRLNAVLKISVQVGLCEAGAKKATWEMCRPPLETESEETVGPSSAAYLVCDIHTP